MKLSNKQLKNHLLDKPTLLESVKELGIMAFLVGALYFLTGIQEIDFDIYSGIVIATAKVLIKIIQEVKKGS